MIDFITKKLRDASCMGFVFGTFCGIVSLDLIRQSRYIEVIVVSFLCLGIFILYKENICEDEIETIFVTQLNDEPNEEYLERLRETIEEANGEEG
ncbi:MAG: hypothetical protein ACOCUI_01460 [bacterium]